MQVFIVGGAVRDALLGHPVKDRDYVVVGATPEGLLAQGYRPVGKDFPVFLHPETHEEYALARTERKSGHGYHGFTFHCAPDVTLEADLARRDLTINAMAQGPDGALVDPYGGRADLQNRVLRHVGPAFAEDPVRILRLARFAARLPDFTVAPETLNLMRAMVTSGEVDHLVAERVWQELAKGLMERHPARMFQVLRDCGALARLLPELDRLFGVPQRPEYHPEVDTGAHILLVIDRAAAREEGLPVRVAALLHDLGKGETPAEILPRHSGHEARGEPLVRAVAERLRLPAECRDLALLACLWHGHIHRVDELRDGSVVEVLERTDAFRRPQRFHQLLAACACDHQGRAGRAHLPYLPETTWCTLQRAAAQVDAGAIAREATAAGQSGQIPARLHEARSRAVHAARADRRPSAPGSASNQTDPG